MNEVLVYDVLQNGGEAQYAAHWPFWGIISGLFLLFAICAGGRIVPTIASFIPVVMIGYYVGSAIIQTQSDIKYIETATFQTDSGRITANTASFTGNRGPSEMDTLDVNGQSFQVACSASPTTRSGGQGECIDAYVGDQVTIEYRPQVDARGYPHLLRIWRLERFGGPPATTNGQRVLMPVARLELQAQVRKASAKSTESQSTHPYQP